jgi:hypothetical protein
MRVVTAVIALLAAACATAPADPVWVEVTETTTRLNCWGEPAGGTFGSRIARSPLFVSPDGRRSAWSEVRALAVTGRASDMRACQNISTLMVAEGGGAYQSAFQQRPGAEGRNGNSLTIVDWSPDSRFLLVELATWTYPTDRDNPLLLVYDGVTRQVADLDAAEAVTRTFGRACRTAFSAGGFTSDGRVVVRLRPSESPPPQTTQCVGSELLFVVDRTGGRLEPWEGAPPARHAGSGPPVAID